MSHLPRRLKFNSKGLSLKPGSRLDSPALQLRKDLLHLLDGGVHLLLEHGAVPRQRHAAALQVLHRLLDAGTCRDSGPVTRRLNTAAPPF